MQFLSYKSGREAGSNVNRHALALLFCSQVVFASDVTHSETTALVYLCRLWLPWVSQIVFSIETIVTEFTRLDKPRNIAGLILDSDLDGLGLYLSRKPDILII